MLPDKKSLNYIAILEFTQNAGHTHLGCCYALGIGTAKNVAEAFKWYKISAERGSSDGACSLGICYNKGISTERNVSEALRWLRFSAEKGNKKALKELKKLEAEELRKQ